MPVLNYLNLNIIVFSVDTYIAENPIPDEYAAKLMLGNNNFITSDSGRVHKITADSFQRKSYSGKWSGSKPKRSRRRR